MVMLNRQEFYDRASKIPYQHRHQEFLYALVRWLRPEVVVEVGTHIGAAAVWLARGLQENGSGLLYCIDPFCWPKEHKQEETWHRNTYESGAQSYIRLIKGRSQDVKWPKPVDMVYIDGNHSSIGCKIDFLKALEAGASCIVLNDHAQFSGVRKVHDEIRRDYRDEWDMISVPFDSGLLVMVKHVPPTNTNMDPDSDPWDK